MPVISGGGGGGTTFNGGTITNPLTIDSGLAGTPALLVESPTHDGSTTALAVKDDLGVDLFLVTDQGDATVTRGLAVSGGTTLGGNVTSVQLYLFAGLAQASPISQVYDGGSALAFQLDKSGRAVISVHSAPADGDLAAGECALWFDQTNGAAKLMVKAKQADGTVRTGSVNLA